MSRLILALPLDRKLSHLRYFRMYRRKKAREFFVERVRQAYEKVFDEENDGYFYYNKLTATSQWTAPRVLLGRPLDPKVGVMRNILP